jgi:hypothetical protein
MRRWTLTWVAALALLTSSGCALQAGDESDGEELVAAEQEALVLDQAAEASPQATAHDVDPGVAAAEPSDIDLDDYDYEAARSADGPSDPAEHLEPLDTEEEDPDPTPWQPSTRSDPSPDPWYHPGDDDSGSEDPTGKGHRASMDNEPTDPDPTPWHAHTEPTPSHQYLVFVDADLLRQRLAH